MDKLILKDGTKIEMVAGASLSAIQIESASRETMLQVWNKLTEENLKEIQNWKRRKGLNDWKIFGRSSGF